MSRNICKQCKHFVRDYWSKNKNGNTFLSKEWCNQKDATIVRIPKKCEFFKAKQE